eukprot:TRINITY_DN73989_c0_g1_i1.p1 TRINITY_DN73989_c0_g1~~TRINITY_DN73989_c0_g1_i1.p1  ORF type:complete len:321 (-),score=73.57 TRINITY_DN73989_c0_g1_i1:44-1006(-)
MGTATKRKAAELSADGEDATGAAAASGGDAVEWVNWKTQARRPFKRQFLPYALAADADPQAVVKRRAAIGVDIVHDPQGEDATPAPVESFEELAVLPPWLLEALRAKGAFEPSPLEAQALPIALAGQNLYGLAGGNRILSYLIPAAVHAVEQPPLSEEEAGPIALILVSSQDLATKVTHLATDLLKRSVKAEAGQELRVVNVSGGGARSEKLKELGAEGSHLVVGTAKRVHDMACKGHLSLARVTMLILDGADRILDQQFEQELRDLATWIRPERQTLALAAVGSKDLRRFVAELCYSGGDAVRIRVKDKQNAGSAAAES